MITPEKTKTVELPGLGQRTYRFPTLFHDVEVLGVVGAVPLAAARGWLPAGLEPRPLPRERALVMLTVQRFAKPAEFPGYEEAALAVFSRTEVGALGFHVLSMPVTSRENLARGPLLFGLPKELAEVRLHDAGKVRVGEVHLGDGAELLFRLELRRRLALPLSLPVRSRYLQLHEGRPVYVASRGRARVALAKATVEAGPLMRRRYPGFPERLAPLGAMRLTRAELRLHLPVPASGG